MAAIKKRRLSWYAVYYLNGKQITRTTGIKVADDPLGKLARQTANSMEATAKGDISVHAAMNAVRSVAIVSGHSSSVPTVRDYLTKGIDRTASMANQRLNKRMAELFIAHLGTRADMRLDAVNASDCRSFLAAFKGRVAYSTICAYRDVLSARFNRAVRDELIPRNPFFSVQLHKEMPREKRTAFDREPFTIEEMRCILTKAPQPWRDIAALSFYTGGQRLSDCISLQWSSVDFAAHMVRFRTQKTGRCIEQPIPQPLYDVLSRLKSESSSSERYVFPRMHSRYLSSPGHVSKEFVDIVKGYGFTNSTISESGREFHTKSFHSIRHTVVSLLRSSNAVSVDLCREVVGHSSEIVERAYFSPSVDAKAQALSILATAIAPPPPAK
jgi:integrase